ncbi:hypothetical protein [Acinetobacter bereziniae]|uniref:hypothetical protein n=1 Tax=Acinetobacter bereziniae TaxID=106648 RepID=UPI00225B4F07|nr:hypothetical protein [Acinetobacter bereziniae]
MVAAPASFCRWQPCVWHTRLVAESCFIGAWNSRRTVLHRRRCGDSTISRADASFPIADDVATGKHG